MQKIKIIHFRMGAAFERGTVSMFANILPLLSVAVTEEKLLSVDQLKRAEEYQSKQGVQ